VRDASEIAFHDSEHSYAIYPLPPHGGWDPMLAFETRDNGLESYLTTLLSHLVSWGSGLCGSRTQSHGTFGPAPSYPPKFDAWPPIVFLTPEHDKPSLRANCSQVTGWFPPCLRRQACVCIPKSSSILDCTPYLHGGSFK